MLTAPAHWNEVDWMYAGFAAAGIGAAASLDNTIKDTVQAHRTTGQDRFFNQYQNLGAAWSFGVIGAFEIWGEVGCNTTAKNTAMDALTSIIGPGLIGTSLKYAVGQCDRIRLPTHFNSSHSVTINRFPPAMPPKHSPSRRPSQKTTRFGGSRLSATAELGWWVTLG